MTIEPHDIINLITPHIEGTNPIKYALVQVLKNMGIPRLPNAREDQYDEIYRRFKAVIDKSGKEAGKIKRRR